LDRTEGITMPSDFDANIKLLYAVDAAGGAFFTI
jgi:hypothetical protein